MLLYFHSMSFAPIVMWEKFHVGHPVDCQRNGLHTMKCAAKRG
jgi:hypothetical protein